MLVEGLMKRRILQMAKADAMGAGREMKRAAAHAWLD